MPRKSNREYFPVELKFQYTEYSGKEKWFIITDLTEEELRTKYPEIKKYEPFRLLSKEIGELEKAGYLTLHGKVDSLYLNKRFFPPVEKIKSENRKE